MTQGERAAQMLAVLSCGVLAGVLAYKHLPIHAAVVLLIALLLALNTRWRFKI